MTALTRREALSLLGTTALLPMATACTSTPSSSGGDLVDSAGAEGTPLHYLSLREVARRIESGDVSPVELTQLMLDRIEAVDGRLKSYATVMADHALAAAHTAEQEIQAGQYRGPLHGVPIAVKDLCYTKGVRTMGGLAVLADFVPDYDATVVSRLDAAGAILLGKLNMTEGAGAGYHRDFDIPVNPWGESLWPGASSSGSGVATAAGLCFASLGSDTGGSIRFPSMANGVVGLKPTYGRVSRYGVLPLAKSLDHVGPMTRRTADAAVVLQTIAGVDPNDRTSLDTPVADMLEALGRGIDGLRLGFDRRYATDGVDSGLAASIDTALEQLSRLGTKVIDVSMPDVPDVLFTILTFEAHVAHQANYPSRADDYGGWLGDVLASATDVSDADYAEALQQRGEFAPRLDAVLAAVDAVVLPASGVPFATSREAQYGGLAEQMWEVDFKFIDAANLAGTPTLSLPCGVSDNGLPYTMQLWGSRLSEPMLCRIGHAYEEATTWHMRHPDV